MELLSSSLISALQMDFGGVFKKYGVELSRLLNPFGLNHSGGENSNITGTLERGNIIEHFNLFVLEGSYRTSFLDVSW